MKSTRSAFLFISLVLSLVPAVAKAKAELNLEDPIIFQWVKLLQYRQSGAGYQSKVHTAEFFLHPLGQTDASAELEAELAGFQKVEPASDQSLQCQFPARYSILKKRFALAPPQPCVLFTIWKKTYDVSHASIIYTSQYLSNPASVFGHAYFLLGSNSIEEYMQATLNYAADVPPDAGSLGYAYYGMTGGFTGGFSVIPFYENRHIYSDIESREMWEYVLKLSPEELDLLVASFWELKNKARFNYYFLDENCGAVLLWVLYAVKPDADFKASNPIYFPPAEITKVLLRNHMVSEVIFRPSLKEKLLAKVELMNAEQRENFKQAIDEKKLKTDFKDALVLEALMDHLNIERYRTQGELSADLKSLERAVLIARSKSPGTDKIEFPEAAKPRPPHLAHESMRLALGAGEENGEALQLFDIRSAFHGLLDREEGFLKNSEIEVVDLQLQNLKNKGVFVEKFRLLGLTNIRPINFYESALSWRFHMDYLRNHFQNEIGHYLELAFDFGYASEVVSPDFTAFAMLANSVRSGARPLGRAETGPKVGFLFSWHRFKFLSQVSRLVELNDFEEKDWWSFQNELRIEVSDRWSVFLHDEERTHVDGAYREREIQIVGAYYF